MQKKIKSKIKEYIAALLLSVSEHKAVFVLFVVFYILLIASYLVSKQIASGTEYFNFVFGKEYLVEQITHLILLLSTLLWFYLFIKADNNKKEALLFCIVSFILLGEEIDWGQSYFGFDNPRFFLYFTSQKVSFNFHSVGPAFEIIGLFLAYILVFKTFLTRFVSIHAKETKIEDFVPLYISALFIFIIAAHFLTIAILYPWLNESADSVVQELTEALIAVLLLMVAIYHYKKTLEF